MPPDSRRPAPFSRQTAYGSFRLDRPSLIALDRALADRLIQALPHGRLGFSLDYSLYHGDGVGVVDRPEAIPRRARVDRLTLRVRIVQDRQNITALADFRQEGQVLDQKSGFLRDFILEFQTRQSLFAADGIDLWVAGDDRALVQDLVALVDRSYQAHLHLSPRISLPSLFWTLWGGMGALWLGGIVGLSVVLLQGVLGLGGGAMVGGTGALLGLAWGGSRVCDRLYLWLDRHYPSSQFQF